MITSSDWIPSLRFFISAFICWGNCQSISWWSQQMISIFVFVWGGAGGIFVTKIKLTIRLYLYLKPCQAPSARTRSLPSLSLGSSLWRVWSQDSHKNSCSHFHEVEQPLCRHSATKFMSFTQAPSARWAQQIFELGTKSSCVVLTWWLAIFARCALPFAFVSSTISASFHIHLGMPSCLKVKEGSSSAQSRAPCGGFVGCRLLSSWGNRIRNTALSTRLLKLAMWHLDLVWK